jgi:hypothetical protein
MLLQPPRSALFHLAVVENKVKRDAHDVVLGCQRLIGLNVYFSDPDFSF